MAVMLLAAAVVRIAVHRDGDAGDPAGPGPATPAGITTAPTPASSPSTVAAPTTRAPATTVSTASAAGGTTVPLVLASAQGVTVVRPAGDPIRISTAPATVAYGVGPDVV